VITDRILVIGADRMCFEVDAKTLKPFGCSYYDAYAFTSPRDDIKRMGETEWNIELNARNRRQRASTT